MKAITTKILGATAVLILTLVMMLALVSCGGESIQGEQGIQGLKGSDGLTPFIGENGNWWIGDTDTGVCATGRDGRDGADGKDGAAGTPGEKGEPGSNGNDGAPGRYVASFEINDDGELVVLYSDATTQNLGKILPEDGKDGSSIAKAEIKDDQLVITMTDGKVFHLENIRGEDAIQPLIRINSESSEWEVSYDSGLTWESLGCTAGGDNGNDSVAPLLRINSTTTRWEVSYNGGDTWEDLGFSAGANDGQDGITPQLRLNYDTKQWEVSYDNGQTWEDAGYSGQNEGAINERVIVNIEIIDGYLWVTYEDSDTPVNIGRVPTQDA